MAIVSDKRKFSSIASVMSVVVGTLIFLGTIAALAANNQRHEDLIYHNKELIKKQEINTNQNFSEIKTNLYRIETKIDKFVEYYLELKERRPCPEAYQQ